MKPINKEENGCDPISSNCVIWQGPDIECLNLCKGDTISNVVNKLATEFCTLLETFNIETYDLDCLNLAECDPEDFRSLIQILINRVCALEGIDNPDTGNDNGSTGCPDCTVNICSEFYYQNPQGDTETTMQLSDYVLAIGNRVCTITTQITTINLTLQNHDQRITDLEDNPAPATPLPQIIPTCTLPQVATDLDIVLTAVEDQFCQLQTTTGAPTTILTALQAACTSLNQSDQLGGTGLMQDITGWHVNPENLAESFSNMWRTVCDLRNAVQFIQNNCCDTTCNAIELDIEASLLNTTQLQLIYQGSIPSNFADSPQGSTISIRNISGAGPQTLNSVPIKSVYYDPGQAHVIDLVGVDGASDLLVTVTTRFVDSTLGTSCENVSQIIVLGTDSCPDLILVPSFTLIDYSFTWTGVIPSFVTMELWDSGETALLQSVPLSITGSNPASQFLNLTEGTAYKIRMVINGVPCDFESFATLVFPCIAATLQAPTIDYSNPTGDQTGSTQAAWKAFYSVYNY